MFQNKAIKKILLIPIPNIVCVITSIFNSILFVYWHNKDNGKQKYIYGTYNFDHLNAIIP